MVQPVVSSAPALKHLDALGKGAGRRPFARILCMERIKNCTWIPRCNTQQRLGWSFRFSCPLFLVESHNALRRR